MQGVKALFFDVFGTLVDWRRGVARDAELVLKPLEVSLDWIAFADAWRDQYQPAMEEVRSGRISYTKLDALHRRTLKIVLASFGVENLREAQLARLTLAWHRLDAWQDVPAGLEALTGFTQPFSRGKIKTLYPSHENYVAKVTAAAKSAREAGVILPNAERDYVQRAKFSTISD